MHEELIKSLTDLGIKKSKVETDLGMPLNSLSGMLAGSKEIPLKWVKPLSDYVIKLSLGLADLAKNGGSELNYTTKEISKTKTIVDKGALIEKTSDKKMEILREAMAKINKDFGAGTVMLLGDKPTGKYDTISTGSLQLDYALGIGGLPRGRIVEVFGWESTGKTTIALNVIANAQKQGLRCLLVDAENSFDPEYANSLGINVDELQYCQPSYGEQGLQVADAFILTGNIGVVVIDSVAALVPKAELEGQMGDSKMGLHARLMSQACRKMIGSVANTNTLLIFINQLRHKIGEMFSNPEVTTGGNALKFYASVRLEVKRSVTEKNSAMNGNVKEGNQTTVKVVKNKCAPPFKKAEFYIMYGKGIDRMREIVDLAIEFNIIRKNGTWFSYKGSNVGQGKDSLIEVLESNPEMAKEIEELILTMVSK